MRIKAAQSAPAVAAGLSGCTKEDLKSEISEGETEKAAGGSWAHFAQLDRDLLLEIEGRLTSAQLKLDEVERERKEDRRLIQELQIRVHKLEHPEDVKSPHCETAKSPVVVFPWAEDREALKDAMAAALRGPSGVAFRSYRVGCDKVLDAIEKWIEAKMAGAAKIGI